MNEQYTITRNGERVPAIMHDGVWHYFVGRYYIVPTGSRWTTVSRKQYVSMSAYRPGATDPREPSIKRAAVFACVSIPLQAVVVFPMMVRLLSPPEIHNPDWWVHVLAATAIWILEGYILSQVFLLIDYWLDRHQRNGIDF